MSWVMSIFMSKAYHVPCMAFLFWCAGVDMGMGRFDQFTFASMFGGMLNGAFIFLLDKRNDR